MASRKTQRIARNPCVNASGEANGRGRGDIHAQCPVCHKRFRPKRYDQTFCSAQCRQLSWWADRLVEAVDSGLADGLRARFRGSAPASDSKGPAGTSGLAP